MKKTLLTFLSVIMLSSFMYSQCVPNTTFTGVLGLDAEAYDFVNESGDSLTALPHANVGDAYATFFDLRVPADTVIEYDLTGNGEPQLFDPVYLTSIGISEIQGLPMGFSYDCASQDPLTGEITEDNCIFSGAGNIGADQENAPDGYGCVRIFSDEVPNVVGTYPLLVVLDIVAEYEVFGVAIPVEVQDDTLLNYMVLIVDEANNSDVTEIVDSRSFQGLGTYPNPFSNSTKIHFGNDKNSEVVFSMYDVLGNLVFTEKINSVIGHNEYIFERGSLVSGLYTYTLFNGDKSISKNIIIQ